MKSASDINSSGSGFAGGLFLSGGFPSGLFTGGGFAGNIPRVLPKGLGARIRRGAWDVPPLFRLIQKGGRIPEDEMLRTFNMGVGMIAVVAPEDLHDVEHSLERRGEAAFVIGAVVEGAGVAFE